MKHIFLLWREYYFSFSRPTNRFRWHQFQQNRTFDSVSGRKQPEEKYATPDYVSGRSYCRRQRFSIFGFWFVYQCHYRRTPWCYCKSADRLRRSSHLVCLSRRAGEPRPATEPMPWIKLADWDWSPDELWDLVLLPDFFLRRRNVQISANDKFRMTSKNSLFAAD